LFALHRIWKKGSSLRADTTLTGFKNFRWQRGDVAFCFLGNGTRTLICFWYHIFSYFVTCIETPGAIILMDNQHKTVEYAIDNLKKHSDKEIEEIADELMKRSTLSMSRTQFRYDKMGCIFVYFFGLFVRSFLMNEYNVFDLFCGNRHQDVIFNVRKGWFGGEKFETVANMNAKIYDMSGLKTETTQRKKPVPTANTSINPKQELYPTTYWQTSTDAPNGMFHSFINK
jgi:hypothetical protein